jgi:hypothetical protein
MLSWAAAAGATAACARPAHKFSPSKASQAGRWLVLTLPVCAALSPILTGGFTVVTSTNLCDSQTGLPISIVKAARARSARKT